MIKLLFPLPEKITVALSGGVDSVAITDFLSRKHDVTCAFYHHNTINSDKAFEFVADFCGKRKLPLLVGFLLGKECPKGKSLENFWRDERYNFLDSLNMPVVTGHHLDDCIETYLWSCMHGTPKVIPRTRKNVVRPFLTTKKSEFVYWCKKNKIDWIDDHSNNDIKFTRNFVRHELMPKALCVNPGLDKVVKRIVEQNKFTFNI